MNPSIILLLSIMHGQFFRSFFSVSHFFSKYLAISCSGGGGGADADDDGGLRSPSCIVRYS